MKVKFIASVVAFFLVAGSVLAIILFGPSILAGNDSAGRTDTSQAAVGVAGKNPITRENAQLGAIGWTIPAGYAATTQIQGYASATSVAAEKSITLYVSTQKADAQYRIDVYRLGWYGGVGARLMTSVASQVGLAQGYYDTNQHRLSACQTCLIDAKTGLIEANWKSSYTLNVPSDWTSGIYLAKFTEIASGAQAYAPFDVLGNANAAYVIVTPDTTYAAYNEWGGASLYHAYGGLGAIPMANGTGTIGVGDNGAKAVKVSFDRPYLEGDGASGVLLYEIQAIRWMEKQGYDISYMSTVDLQNNPAQLLQHKAYISLGQDAYWTKEMRDGVEAARDHGVGLAFMGADIASWQMRFASDSVGTPDRTVICYKVSTSNNDLAHDPLYGTDNARLTALWRDTVLGRPENMLMGIMFSDATHKQQGFAWKVSDTSDATLFKDTDLQKDHSYGCGVVGNEWDRVFPNGTPTGLHVLATSPTLNDTGQADSSNTTYYSGPSGAMVFATGSLYWTTALDSWRFATDKACNGQNLVIPAMQTFMANVMDALIVKHTPTS